MCSIFINIVATDHLPQILSGCQPTGQTNFKFGPEETQDLIAGDDDNFGMSSLLIRGLSDNASTSVLHQSDLDFLAQAAYEVRVEKC